MKLLPALLITLLLAACANPTPVYVQGDRLTHNKIAPEYLRYVEADPDLTAMQRETRVDLVASWALRIEAAEAPR